MTVSETSEIKLNMATSGTILSLWVKRPSRKPFDGGGEQASSGPGGIKWRSSANPGAPSVGHVTRDPPSASSFLPPLVSLFSSSRFLSLSFSRRTRFLDIRRDTVGMLRNSCEILRGDY